MGLSGAKKKNKISRDPNNNGWASSTDRFGHRMLTSQGWTPGSYLGAKDAAHAGHYTAANASHIRVLLKDDNLGLGAKRGPRAETFGLSTLQGIFGRLNGKSDAELVREEKSQRDAELGQYQSQRWGYVQFVSGGFLVGDSIQRLPGAKGAKARGEVGDVSDGVKEDTKKESKKRKRSDDPSSEEVSAKKRPSKRATDDGSTSAPASTTGAASAGGSEDETVAADKRRSKEERRKRKEERRQRRLERQAKREAKALKKRKRQLGDEAEAEAGATVSIPEPSNAATSPPVAEAQAPIPPAAALFGRQAVRSRYIRQKRMALSDAKALNEILMIKAQG